MQLKRHCIEANVKPDKARKISNLLCLGQTSWTKIILNALLIQAKPGKADDTFMHSAAACSRPTFAQNLQLKLFLLFHTNQTAFRNLTNAQKCMVKDLFILRLHYLKINIKILTFYWIFFGKHMILLHFQISFNFFQSTKICAKRHLKQMSIRQIWAIFFLLKFFRFAKPPGQFFSHCWRSSRTWSRARESCGRSWLLAGYMFAQWAVPSFIWKEKKKI